MWWSALHTSSVRSTEYFVEGTLDFSHHAEGLILMCKGAESRLTTSIHGWKIISPWLPVIVALWFMTAREYLISPLVIVSVIEISPVADCCFCVSNQLNYQQKVEVRALSAAASGPSGPEPCRGYWRVGPLTSREKEDQLEKNNKFHFWLRL